MGDGGMASPMPPSCHPPSHHPPSRHPPSRHQPSRHPHPTIPHHPISTSPHLHIRSCYLDAMAEPILGGPASVVETACPLDCPDACSLSVTVQHGKVITIDGSHKNPVTDGYICAKVRKFGDRVYGP